MHKNIEIPIEKTILSTILFNPDKIENVIKVIKPNDFYVHSHKLIFEAILELHREDMPIEEEFIRKKVKINIEEILLDILSTNPITDIEAYAKEVKNSALKRELEQLSVKIKQFSLDERLNAYEALNQAEEIFNSISNNSMDDFLKATPLTQIKEEDTNYICKNYVPLPEHAVILISARGGVGKTWAAIKIADETIKEDSKKKVLILATEDRKGKLKARANKLEINNPNIVISDIDPFFLLEKDYKTQNYKPTEDFYKFKSAIKDYALIIIDPLIAFYNGKENDNGDARIFMQQITNLAKKMKKTFAIIHHADKDEKGSRGAGAFADATRLTYFVSKDYSFEKKGDKYEAVPKNNNKLRFEVQKQNDNIESVKKLENITKISDIGSFAVNVFPIQVETTVMKEEQKNNTSMQKERRESVYTNPFDIDIEGIPFQDD